MSAPGLEGILWFFPKRFIIDKLAPISFEISFQILTAAILHQTGYNRG